MKRSILILFLIFSLFEVCSQETVRELFLKQRTPSPELIKQWRSKSKIDESYNFVKYKINDKDLFSKIARISNKIFAEKSKRYTSKSSPKIDMVKKNGLTYIRISFNPFHKFIQPRYPMPQPAGFAYYERRTYELTFWSSDAELFTPTKEIKKVIYKKDKNDLYIHFESIIIYLQIKGDEVKEVSDEMII